MTATYVQLHPISRAIVAALALHGPLTTSQVHGYLARDGHACPRVSLKTRLRTLCRDGLVVKTGEVWVRPPGNRRGGWEARYRLAMQEEHAR